MFYADPQWTKSLKNQHCDPDRTLQTDIRPFAHGKYSTIILAYVTQNSVIMSGQLLASSDILSGNLKISSTAYRYLLKDCMKPSISLASNLHMEVALEIMESISCREQIAAMQYNTGM